STRTVSLDLLLPPSFQVTEPVEPTSGEAPPNLRPPAFETIQPPPMQTEPLPAPVQPLGPSPAPPSVTPSLPTESVPLDPQAPPPTPSTPVAPRPLSASSMPPTAVIPTNQPDYEEVHDTVQETRVSTQTEYLQSSPPPSVRP